MNYFIQIVVPSQLMSPTLKVGNQLFVTKVYNTSNIKRGDILLFNSARKNKVKKKYQPYFFLQNIKPN
ncbi:S26 family signal peptidase [Clostridium perfringens]|uniref:S26 family signal peptidase n=1 Tax=Clostridium perfringens TaxID=1502 RepID=UPI003D2F60CD